ncbi:MAG TPA: hypothetical protein ENI19_02235 [Candidatus Nealsonbacteria bacterium]|nr:hypothetical protein [Candidatus Nealsonbacteria bacterium]
MRTSLEWIGKIIKWTIKAIEIFLAAIVAILFICLSISVIPIVGTLYFVSTIRRGYHGICK